MKISDLRTVLDEFNTSHGDIEISVLIPDQDDMLCEVEIEIGLAFIEKTPFLSFILKDNDYSDHTLQ